MKTAGTTQPNKTAAQQAFLASGLDIAYVARVVNLSPGYLKTQLRTGCQCYVTAERLRRVLNCPVELFLPKPKPAKTNTLKSTNILKSTKILKSTTKERGGPLKKTA